MPTISLDSVQGLRSRQKAVMMMLVLQALLESKTVCFLVPPVDYNQT